MKARGMESHLQSSNLGGQFVLNGSLNSEGEYLANKFCKCSADRPNVTHSGASPKFSYFYKFLELYRENTS